MIDEVESNPEWIPHALNLKTRTVDFLRVPEERYSATGFLFEYASSDPADCISMSFEQVSEIEVEALPLHFIFHTAFCRSTLLARALNIRGISIGMSEPGIIADLSAAGPSARHLIAPVVRLLARKRDGVKTVFIKPTNHANRLIPDLMNEVPEAHAILMSNPVTPFLKSVRKRGLMGHRWGRGLYMEMQGYSPLDFGMPPNEVFAMTDLQVAGAAWLLNQHYFTRLLSTDLASRLRTLDGDYFNAQRGKTIAAVLEFCGIAGHDAAALEDNEVFSRHSKLGGAVAEHDADASTQVEIAQVSHWLDLIGNQIGLSLPVGQTLL